MPNIQKIVLSEKSKFEFFFKGLLIFVEIDKAKEKIRLRTTVFSEKNYIPLSVRSCVEKLFEKNSNKKFPLILEIDYLSNKVDLVQDFIGDVNIPIIKLIKLFSFIARTWAPILKKIAKNDLLNI